MGTGELNVGGNPGMDQHPGGVEILLVASYYRDKPCLMGHLAHMQTPPFYMWLNVI